MLVPTTTTPQAMLTQISPEGSAGCRRPPLKISIVGSGTLGAAIGYTLLLRDLCSELVLIDKNEALARSEMLDMRNATIFLDNQQISSSTDYSAVKNSRVIIITAGARGFDDKRNEATMHNTEIFREIIPQMVTHASDAILIVCSYPVDEMSYVAWRLSGLPPHKVIGLGTYLETSRLRSAIAEKMHIHPSCCRVFVIGEQGSKCLPIWSSANVAGVRLTEINPDLGTPLDPEDWMSLFKDIIDSAEEIGCLKEVPTWSMAVSVARLVNAVLKDTGECFTISTHIKGCRHGINKDVFLSLPVIIGCTGVKHLIKQTLTDDEKEQLQKSADRIFDLLKQLNLDTIKPTTLDCSEYNDD